MARRRESAARHATSALILSALVSTSIAWGQDNVPPTTPAMPAPFSRDCQIDTDPVARRSPLPNVAAALQKSKTIRILAIGASPARRTFRGGHVGEILQQAIKGLDVVMINRGVSGELAAQAAARIQTEVALNEPDLVLWQVGTNDALAYVPLADLETTIVDTVRWLKEHNVDVVLVGLQYVNSMERDDNYRAVRELIRRIGPQENVMIVRRPEALRLLSQAASSGGGLQPDEFERSEAGYTCLAQYVARAITLGLFGVGNPPRQPQPTPPAPRQPAPAPQTQN